MDALSADEGVNVVHEQLIQGAGTATRSIVRQALSSGARDDGHFPGATDGAEQRQDACV